jgi:hypothetical protein
MYIEVIMYPKKTPIGTHIYIKANHNVYFKPP